MCENYPIPSATKCPRHKVYADIR